jgi:copper(I)-binding protein
MRHWPGEQPVARRYSGRAPMLGFGDAAFSRDAAMEVYASRGCYDPRMTRARLVVAAALTAVLAVGHAVAQTPRTLSVTQPWVRPAGRGATSEAYMELVSSVDATLVAAASPRAASVAVRPKAKGASSIALPARERVVLKAGGDRLVLLRIAEPLKLGDKVPLTLTIAYGDGTREPIEINAEVRLRSPVEDERRHHH